MLPVMCKIKNEDFCEIQDLLENEEKLDREKLKDFILNHEIVFIHRDETIKHLTDLLNREGRLCIAYETNNEQYMKVTFSIE